jgi:hypothetical protein
MIFDVVKNTLIMKKPIFYVMDQTFSVVPSDQLFFNSSGKHVTSAKILPLDDDIGLIGLSSIISRKDLDLPSAGPKFIYGFEFSGFSKFSRQNFVAESNTVSTDDSSDEEEVDLSERLLEKINSFMGYDYNKIHKERIERLTDKINFFYDEDLPSQSRESVQQEYSVSGEIEGPFHGPISENSAYKKSLEEVEKEKLLTSFQKVELHLARGGTLHKEFFEALQSDYSQRILLYKKLHEEGQNIAEDDDHYEHQVIFGDFYNQVDRFRDEMKILLEYSEKSGNAFQPFFSKNVIDCEFLVSERNRLLNDPEEPRYGDDNSIISGISIHFEKEEALAFGEHTNDSFNIFNSDFFRLYQTKTCERIFGYKNLISKSKNLNDPEKKILLKDCSQTIKLLEEKWVLVKEYSEMFSKDLSSRFLKSKEVLSEMKFMVPSCFEFTPVFLFFEKFINLCEGFFDEHFLFLKGFLILIFTIRIYIKRFIFIQKIFYFLKSFFQRSK